MLLNVGVVQLAFGQNEAQGRGSVGGDAVDLLPVFGLGSKLVAGNNSPFAHISFAGKKDVSRLHAELEEFFVHSVPPSYVPVWGILTNSRSTYLYNIIHNIQNHCNDKMCRNSKNYFGIAEKKGDRLGRKPHGFILEGRYAVCCGTALRWCW